MRLWARWQIVVIIASTLFTVACEEKKPDEDLIPVAPQVASLRIVHDPGLKPYLDSVKEQFALQNPKLSDGTPITLELVPELGISAARKIASGDLKADAWIAPSLSLVNFVNANIRNLGARQTDCTPLFSTPIVLATDARNQNAFNSRNQEFSWNSLSETKLALGTEGPLATRFAYSHGAPDRSASGFEALLQLAYLASVSTSDVLNLDTLKLPQSLSHLEAYERYVSSYGMDEAVLLERTAGSGTKRVRFTITSEQQVAMFNVNRGDNTNPLIALYPEEGSVWQEYNFCLSGADWVTPAHRAALRILGQFLSSAAPQTFAKKRGFRPSVLSITEAGALSEQYGVNTQLPKKSLRPVSGDVVDYLLGKWVTLQRPSATLFVLDASGSMEGAPLSEAKDFLRKAISSGTARDIRGLVSFSTRPRMESRFTSEIPILTKRVDDIQAVGGSAVYDGLRMAIDLATEPEANPYRRTVVMITDGDDKNSEVSLQMISDLVSDKFARYDMNFIVIAITTPGADYSDLKRLARAGNGIYREGSFDQLSSLFDEISQSL